MRWTSFSDCEQMHRATRPSTIVRMATVTCPSCTHAFDAAASSTAPDPSVLLWFRSSPPWLGELTTHEVYTAYLQAISDTPVSRESFVADMTYFGIREVTDGDSSLLIPQ